MRQNDHNGPLTQACERCSDALAALTEEIRLLRSEVRALRSGHDGVVLDLDQAAEFLGTSRRTIERWIAAKRLHATKLAPGTQGSVRVLRSELDRFLANRTRS